jgi:DNA-binding MarR family transcriptional regulator
MEIAQSIKMSHPSVINIINKMTSSGYIDSEKDTNDSRRRLLTLSE